MVDRQIIRCSWRNTTIRFDLSNFRTIQGSGRAWRRRYDEFGKSDEAEDRSPWLYQLDHRWDGSGAELEIHAFPDQRIKILGQIMIMENRPNIIIFITDYDEWKFFLFLRSS